MKIQFLNGGLANQIFQYIFYRYAQLSTGKAEEWFLDDSFFFIHHVHNGYELERVFGLKPRLLSRYFDPDVWEYMLDLKRRENKSIPQILLENGNDIVMVSEADNFAQWNPFKGKLLDIEVGKYLPDLVRLPGDIYYHGYWINKHYLEAYRDIILKELSFPPFDEAHNLEYKKKIENSESFALHIRRGDYVEIGSAFKESDIRQAVETAVEAMPEVTFFVFSDDLPWCREHASEMGLDLPRETVFVEGNTGEKAYRDLQLMSLCRSMVVGTSAFNYLAALINGKLKENGYLSFTEREI